MPKTRKYVSPHHCKVRCRDEAIAEAAMSVGEFVEMLMTGRTEAYLLKSGAKAYWQGGGWWHILGYAHDASDTISSLEAIREASERGNTEMQSTAYDPRN